MSESVVETKARHATALLRLAEKEYSAKMCNLFPIRTRWVCRHGTPGEYMVDIIDFSFDRGFLVENISTRKRKYVYWGDLVRQVNV